MFSHSPLPRIPEILKVICDHLVEEKPTLARLARTCKDFENPALNVLEMEELNDGEKTLVLTQPLTSLHSCERLFYYSTRVRSYFDSSQGCTTFVEKLVYEALHLVTQGVKILLPNIQRLTWDCNDEYFPYIYMFMGPNLAKIELTFAPSSLAHLSLLSVLYERHPLLTDVSLWYATDEGSVEQQESSVRRISSFVYRWQTLQNLEVENLTYPALRELAKLPQLKRLSLLRCQLDMATSHPTPKPGGFPALNDLLLEGCSNPSDCIAVLKRTDHSPLYLIRATFQGIETSATINAVFEMAVEHCNHATLRQLEIEDGIHHNNGLSTSFRRDMVKFDVLKPLFVFRRMRWVSIELTRGIQISEPSMVEEMLTSWPKVQELLVKSRPFTRCARPVITLQDLLLCIADRSPRLEILALAFDATSPPVVEADNANSISVIARKLAALYVGDSPIKNPSLVAASLSGVFPSLKTIKTIEDEEDLLQTRDGENEPTHKVWKKAEELLQVFSAVRSQERLYAKLHKNDEEPGEEDTSDEE